MVLDGASAGSAAPLVLPPPSRTLTIEATMVMAFRHYFSSPPGERGMRTTAQFVNAEFGKMDINVKLTRDFIRDVLKVTTVAAKQPR